MPSESLQRCFFLGAHGSAEDKFPPSELPINAQGVGTERAGNTRQRYCRGAHAWHCDAVTGKVKGGPILKRITASEAEQKLLVPVSLETGMATTANFLHTCL
jgi:hypothetical protein